MVTNMNKHVEPEELKRRNGITWVPQNPVDLRFASLVIDFNHHTSLTLTLTLTISTVLFRYVSDITPMLYPTSTLYVYHSFLYISFTVRSISEHYLPIPFPSDS